jgi:hypothetical protein
VIKGITGYVKYAKIYVNPSNIFTLLPEDNVSDREGIILGIYKGLKSSYRKEFLSKHDVKEDEINALVERGLLLRNKTGIKISTNGKNYAKTSGVY